MKERTERWTVVTAVALFLINIACAWWTMFSTSDHIAARPEGHVGSEFTAELEKASGATATNLVQLRIRSLEAEVHLKAVSNKQAMVVTAMAGAFSLIAVGLALFVMGAKGALEITVDSPDRGKLLLQATTPGLACFILAAVVICFAVSQRSAIELRPYELQVDSRQRADSTLNSAAADPADPGRVRNVEEMRRALDAGDRSNPNDKSRSDK